MKEFYQEIPEYLIPVMARLEDNGFEAYLVGGCVRDCAMGRVPNDYDLTTSATPEEMCRVFSDFRLIETGLKHGTVTVCNDGEQIEITTYRIDGAYNDNRHPESVSFTRNLTEDLSRRDFTVNAMAYSPARGLCDPFGGMKDIARRVIACVGEPEKRFAEDGLRILRAVRFASVLDFGISPDTAEAVHALAYLLDGISRERIFTELSKLVCGVGVNLIFRDFADVLSRCVRGVSEETFEKCSHLMEKLPCDSTVRFSFLYYMESPEHCFDLAASAMAHLKSSTAENRRARALAAECKNTLPKTDAEIRRLMSHMCEENIMAYVSMRSVLGDDAEAFLENYRRVAAADPCVSIKQLAVNGNDVMKLTGKKGGEVGASLIYLLDRVIEGELRNDRDELVAELLRL